MRFRLLYLTVFGITHTSLSLGPSGGCGNRVSLWFYFYILLIYVWLCWVSIVVWGLSRCGKWGLLFPPRSAWAPSAGLALLRHRRQGVRASVAAAYGLSSCGQWLWSLGLAVAVHRLSCSAARGISPDWDWTRALHGGFSSIVPPGKSLLWL